MSNKRILYVCQEIMPYLPESHMSKLSRNLPQAIQEKGFEVRTFMPRYGCINERRNQLHEVIRLSGMNLIIDDNDHQLIIKVASIPSARVQIYFIDNEEYFQRKNVLTDDDDKYFDDNDERSIFFARGVIETVKKLRWSPSIVHCHGWFSGTMAAYLKEMLTDDPLFKGVKVVLSLYDDKFDGELGKNMAKKITAEGINAKNAALLEEPTYENFIKFVCQYVDGVMFASANVDEAAKNYLKKSSLPLLEWSEEENYVDRYAEFYDKILL